MHDLHLLQEIVIILSLSVVAVFICHRFKLPPILGFLLTGIVAGPTGMGFIAASHEVEMLSEIGVILLLFVIGLEFSLKKLAAIKHIILIAGTIQVFFTIAIVYIITTMLTNMAWESAVFLGFLFSLSSTAIVLKLLQERGEMNSNHGKIVLGILIFQDIIVVPMMLFTPLLAGGGENPMIAVTELLFKAVGVVIAVIFLARYIVPKLLFAITKTKIKELFLLSIVVICFAVAWATFQIGLSLALGAFLAGLIISESEYSYHATGLIIPFREIFTSFFFVSIGMLLDLQFLFDHFVVVLALTLLVFIVKSFTAGISAIVLKYSVRTAIFAGLSLFQVGEFAFILAAVGSQYLLIDPVINQYFLAISITTMAITPLFIQNFNTIGHVLAKNEIRKKLLKWEGNKSVAMDEEQQLSLHDHVVIIGYGLNGKNVARAARFANIPYVIIETNATTVKRERENGEPIFYGDATNVYLLEHLHVEKARVAVVAISDPEATRKVIINLRTISPTLYLIIRTRFFAEIGAYKALGANEVIPEEFETSIEIFSRLLHQYHVPEKSIHDLVLEIRNDNYTMLRPANGSTSTPVTLDIPDMNVCCLTVQRHDNEVVGKRLSDANIRAKYLVNLVGIVRNDDLITNLGPNTIIATGDILYVTGAPEDISNFNELISER